MSTYRPTTSRPIPTGCRRSPSPSSSAHSSSSHGGSDFSHGHGWQWRHPPERSSSGHSSDLIFAMEPERRSDSGSPLLRAAEQPFLYDVPSSWDGRPPDPGTVPVCPRCRRQFNADHASQQRHGVTHHSRNVPCPSCLESESWQQGSRRLDEDEFYPSSADRWYRTPTQRPSTYEAPYEVTTPTSARRPTHSSSAHATNRTHLIWPAFPSFGGPATDPPPYTRSVSQPNQSAPRWTDVSLPRGTFVPGSYRPRCQLPQLITQLERRAAPASAITPPTADPFGMTPASAPSRPWRQA